MPGIRTALIVIATALVLGVSGWWLLRSSAPGTDFRAIPVGTIAIGEPPAAPGFATTTSGSATESAAGGLLKRARRAPAGYTEYRSERYRFALFYPSDLKVKEYDEGGGAATITFQNTATVQGFQIFVVPYKAHQVSEAQFKRDAPSGVMQNPKDVSVDGAVGTSFFSTNAALGETAEVWFIRGGYLFEVTTLKPLADELSQVIKSWQFM